MSFFETYYRIEYALPKMDKISIPDYSSGGENIYSNIIIYSNISLIKDLITMVNNFK